MKNTVSQFITLGIILALLALMVSMMPDVPPQEKVTANSQHSEISRTEIIYLQGIMLPIRS